MLYIAMSLDGYIADGNGGVGWLGGDGSDIDNPGSYPEFIKTVDVVVIGYNTYHQLITELAPEGWVYEDKLTYVLTHRKLESTKNIIFTAQKPADLIANLNKQPGLDIWICGGARTVNEMFAADLIDVLTITVIPTILGDGIPLFFKHDEAKQLRLLETKSYNGMIDLVYERIH